MNKRIELIVLEDAADERNALIEQIDAKNEYFHLNLATGSSTEAFNEVTSRCPDAVIVDLDLHDGEGDGFEFLQNIKNAHLPCPPYLLVTTWNISQLTFNAARELGADYVLSKARRDYTPEEPLKLLLSIKHLFANRVPKDTSASAARAEEEHQAEKRLIKRITSEITKVGINPKSKGYAYLTDAIAYVVLENKSKACDYVARKWGKAESSVERAMQNAINRAWNMADTKELLANYTAIIKSDRGVPTLTEFIYYYAMKIRPDFDA